VLAQKYRKLNGNKFAKFIKRYFPRLCTAGSRLFLQDGDPSQNSAPANQALQTLNIDKLLIPPRSPDMNPIENVFHLLNQQLRKDAIAKRITKETFHKFQKRVVKTLKRIPAQIIDNIISSMDKRMHSIIKRQGNALSIDNVIYYYYFCICHDHFNFNKLMGQLKN